jgi:predicted nucleic acid-binding protein
MKAVFADTFYFLALLNERDAAHKRVVAAGRTTGLSLVTTELVLLELADALCKVSPLLALRKRAGTHEPF